MKIAVSVVAVAAAIWALCNYVLFPDVVLSCRLTAEVAMAGQTYTGSAVVETRWTQTLFNPLGLADNWTEREKGEAVVVDMGEHGVVLVTLAGYTQQQPKLLPQMVFGTGDIRSLARDRRVMPVKPDDMPVVIWLRDRLDSSSPAVCIEPDGTTPPVADAPSFPRVQMWMVDEPPTERIEAVLPWLGPILRSDPYGEGNYRFIDRDRRYPERLCYCSARDLKRNRF